MEDAEIHCHQLLGTSYPVPVCGIEVILTALFRDGVSKCFYDSTLAWPSPDVNSLWELIFEYFLGILERLSFETQKENKQQKNVSSKPDFIKSWAYLLFAFLKKQRNITSHLAEAYYV